MDLRISYLNGEHQLNSILNYEQLVAEITGLIPNIMDLNFSYQDEEGDEIQVSNTSDLFAISKPDAVVLKLDAKVDQDRIDKQKQKQEQVRLQQFEKKKQALQDKIVAEAKRIAELTAERETLQIQQTTKVQELEAQMEVYNEFKTQPLPDFGEEVKKSDLFDTIREKEAQLLMLEGKKEFDTQLKTMIQEIHQSFHSLYAVRGLHFQATYTAWKQNQAQKKKLEQEIDALKSYTVKNLLKLEEQVVHHQDKKTQYENELNVLE